MNFFDPKKQLKVKFVGEPAMETGGLVVIRIKRILTENWFPRSIIDRVIKSFLDEKFGKRSPKKADDKTSCIFCLPYLGHYGLQVKTRLIRLVKQCYPRLKFALCGPSASIHVALTLKMFVYDSIL